MANYDFCSNCGSPLPESGVCHNCNPVLATDNGAVEMETPLQVNVAQNVAQLQEKIGPIITKASPVFGQTVAVLKDFFLVNPGKAVDTAMQTKLPVWSVLGGFYVLVIALGIMMVTSGILRGIFGSILSGMSDSHFYVESQVRQSIPNGALFGMGLVLSFVSFAVIAGGAKVIYSIHKKGVSFLALMNMVASALLISTVSVVVGTFVSFLYLPLAFLIFAAGGIGSIVMVYRGIQRLARWNEVPIWGFLILYAVLMIALVIIGRQMAIPILGNILQSILGDLSGFMGGFLWEIIGDVPFLERILR